MSAEALPTDLLERVVQVENVAWYDWFMGREKIRVSSAYAEMFDLDGDNVTTQTTYEVLHPDDLPAFRAAHVAFFKSQDTHLTVEYRFRQRGGVIRWARVRAMAERDAAGRVTRMTGTVADITEAKEQEAQNRAYAARQEASVEVLKAISESPDDTQPVFELIARHAAALCGATSLGMVEFDGTVMHARVMVRRDPGARQAWFASHPRPPGPETVTGRVILTGQTLNIRDTRSDPLLQFGSHEAEVSRLGVPLLRDGRPIGAIVLARAEAGGFTAGEIALVESFAEQAALAIAGAQTLRELRERTAELAERNTAYSERIEHQSATIDVLKEMAASPDDAQPVFDLICQQAKTVLGVAGVGLFEYDGVLVHHRTPGGFALLDPAAYAAYRRSWPRVPDRDSLSCRAILDGTIIHIRDMDAEPGVSQVVRDLGNKTQVSVPLLRDGRAIGAITTGSTRVDGISDTQIELLKTFAEQAVIAITSAETYRALQARTADLQESLQYQTATSDVLKVISRSAFDLDPALENLLAAAARLCDADSGTISTVEGDHTRTSTNYTRDGSWALPTRRGDRFPISRSSIIGRTVIEARVIHVEDVGADPEHIPPGLPAGSKLSGTMLGVPLLRDGVVIGVIRLARDRVLPFSDRQIDLVTTFADQAVIAIENTRLITETREALERQTATADVLQVINANPGDPGPVFDAILESAHRVCGASIGSLWLYDGELTHAVATRGMTEEDAAIHRRPRPMSPAQRTVLIDGARYFHSADRRFGGVEISSDIVAAGVQTVLGVPLVKDGRAIGVIGARRLEARPFADREIELLESFAAQAVIAMENARLITETREALEQQTAIAEVLQAINAWPGDLAPVFDAILEKALRLADSAFGVIYLHDNDTFQEVASRALPEALKEYYAGRPPVRASTYPPVLRLRETRRPYQRLDIRESETYVAGYPGPRALAELGGARSLMDVPLIKDQEVVGNILIYRQEIRAYTDKHIALLESFAAQAVIAMENARLLTETREALAQQTATAEVLRAINASPGNLKPVFDAILEKAMHLCGAAFGNMSIWDGELVHPVATRGFPPAFAAYMASRGSTAALAPVVQRMMDTKLPMQVADVRDGDGYRNGHPDSRAVADLGGARSLLHVPLLKDETFVGYLTVYRQEQRPYSDKEVALLENFAAQAVIAMENARLLGELRDRTADLSVRDADNQALIARQAASIEVLKAIAASPDDPQPVFELIVRRACELCNAQAGNLFDHDGTMMHIRFMHGFAPEAEARLRAVYPRLPGHDTLPGRVVLSGQRVHLPDAQADQGLIQQGRGLGARAFLGVPLLREGRVIGVLALARFDPGEYDQSAIELVQSFAAQAVIAMESARLLGELRASLEQQTATAEVLATINASPGDTAPVFDAILDKSLRLANSSFGTLWLYDGDEQRPVAFRGMSEALAAFWATETPPRVSSRPHLARMRETKRSHQTLDLKETDGYRNGNASAVAFADLGGARSMVLVPLVKDGAVIGNFNIFRQEVRAFSDKEIALLESFAAQAVIAMENARLLTEQREALERQTATAEVLEVINANPGDLAPVFDTMLDKAMRLCGVAFGMLFTWDGTERRPVAARGLPPAFAAVVELRPATADIPPLVARMLASARTSQIADAKDGEGYRAGHEAPRALVDLGGARTTLHIPLVKDGASVGHFTFYRQEVRLFSDKEIALLESFAAQAVIAMENARLLGELRESLERRTAMAEVLRIINTSQGDLEPVFRAILDAVLRLSESAFGSLMTYDGEILRGAVNQGFRPTLSELRPEPGTMMHRVVYGGEDIVWLPDIRDDDAYRAGLPSRVAIADGQGARTQLVAGLRADDRVVGLINIFRREVKPFTESQIALIKAFAAQAVIAMENARLLTEQREALERQTAVAEVLQVINANPGNLAPVFDTILEKALAICQPAFGSLAVFEASRINTLATRGETEALARFRASYRSDALPPSVVRLIETKHPVHLLDMREGEGYRSGHPGPVAMADLGGARSLLLVPLLKDQTVVGDIQIYRQEVRAFTDKEIALLESFAAQAVVAMENARLLNEIRAARDHAEATLRELKIAQANLVQAEKMASLGQLTAGIAHEIKNPLNFVNNFAALSVDLLEELKETAAPGFAILTEDQRADIDDVSAMLTTNLQKITEHGKRADGIVRAMLEHSRGSSGERREVDLNALVDEALNLAYHGARAQDQSFNITLERDYADGIAPIEVNPQDLTRVFLNLFSNGFYAANKRTREGGEAGFEPTLRVSTTDRGDWVEVRVRDNGTGIPPDIRDKLFQPFFTTKPTGEGTGLGLSITYDIVTKQHGGAIAVDSEVGAFTEFVVSLPRHMFAGEGDRS